MTHQLLSVTNDHWTLTTVIVGLDTRLRPLSLAVQTPNPYVVKIVVSTTLKPYKQINGAFEARSYQCVETTGDLSIKT